MSPKRDHCVDPLARFAEQAALYETWLVCGEDRNADAARECLIRLLELVLGALRLPRDPPGGSESDEGVERVSEEEWRSACAAGRRLPLDGYRASFDPADLAESNAGIGSLVDDVADVYRDVVSGPRAYRVGDLSGAHWEWTSGMRTHWGQHATSAIRVLHAWLARNALDQATNADSKARDERSE